MPASTWVKPKLSPSPLSFTPTPSSWTNELDAESLGLHTTGVLGCLVLAKRYGHLHAGAPVIAELQTIAGCWFADA